MEEQYRLLIRNQVLTLCQLADKPQRPEDLIVELEDGWLKVPEGITGIGDRAFLDCPVYNVHIPSSVKWIGEEAFYGCNYLENIVLPAGLTQIEAGTFRQCYALKGPKLPSSITRIGRGAFQECSHMKSMKLPAGIDTIGEAAFQKCKSLVGLTVPEGVRGLPAYLFDGCTNLKEFSISPGIQKMGTAAFQNCESLKALHFPDSLEELPNNICFNCSSLSSIHLPENLKCIQEAAFAYCRSLSQVQLPDGLLTVEHGAFYNCTLLKNLEFPSSVNSIWDIRDLFFSYHGTKVTIHGHSFVDYLIKVSPSRFTNPEDAVLRAPDVICSWLPYDLWPCLLKGFAELCLEGVQMNEKVRFFNMVGLGMYLLDLWEYEPARIILLEQKNLYLDIAQYLVKEAAERNMPEQTSILLEYIHTNFTQEELDQARERQQQRLLEGMEQN